MSRRGQARAAEPRSAVPVARHARVLMRLVHGVTARHSERATMGLTVRQRLVIQRLGIEGNLPIAVLGERLGLSPSTMTGLTDRLEAEGYVRRRAHPTDRRARQVALTRRGLAAFEREAAFYLSLLEETVAALGAGARAHVLRALEMIAARGRVDGLPAD